MRILAALALALLLAGCATPTTRPSEDVARHGSLPGLVLHAVVEGATVTVTLRNEGLRAHQIHDDCAESWLDARVVAEGGGQVFPEAFHEVCDMVSEPRPLPPGDEVRRTVAWDGADWTRDGKPEVPPGAYRWDLVASTEEGTLRLSLHANR